MRSLYCKWVDWIAIFIFTQNHYGIRAFFLKGFPWSCYSVILSMLKPSLNQIIPFKFSSLEIPDFTFDLKLGPWTSYYWYCKIQLMTLLILLELKRRMQMQHNGYWMMDWSHHGCLETWKKKLLVWSTEEIQPTQFGVHSMTSCGPTPKIVKLNSKTAFMVVYSKGVYLWMNTLDNSKNCVTNSQSLESDVDKVFQIAIGLGSK